MKEIILIHGFQKNGENDFKSLIELLKNNENYNLKYIKYFDNYDKKTFKKRKIYKEINNVLKNCNKNAIVICYSTGCILTSRIYFKNKYMYKTLFIAPPIKINVDK